MTTVIVGGGLSGLVLAESLENRGIDCQLLEARSRFGGRIKTCHYNGAYFDMGPAWFWPGQPRIAALIDHLNLAKFDQFADGVLTFEDEQGRVQHGQGFSSMEGSWRLVGGLSALTDALAARIPENRKRLNAVVSKLELVDNGCRVTLSNGEVIDATSVVLALPPRVAAEIDFSPALPSSTLKAMQGVATWMAGQAKAVAVYDSPFWRDNGLSGDAMSRRGPMVEIHDASPEKGGPYALFGFIGIPPHARADEQFLRQQLMAQLVRLFGSQAADPVQLFIKDWAFDARTATEADKAPLHVHPAYGLPQEMHNLWNNKLQFGGTEVAPTFGGYIEGALEAAETVLDRLK